MHLTATAVFALLSCVQSIHAAPLTATATPPISIDAQAPATASTSKGLTTKQKWAIGAGSAAAGVAGLGALGFAGYKKWSNKKKEADVAAQEENDQFMNVPEEDTDGAYDDGMTRGPLAHGRAALDKYTDTFEEPREDATFSRTNTEPAPQTMNAPVDEYRTDTYADTYAEDEDTNLLDNTRFGGSSDAYKTRYDDPKTRHYVQDVYYDEEEQYEPETPQFAQEVYDVRHAPETPQFTTTRDNAMPMAYDEIYGTGMTFGNNEDFSTTASMDVPQPYDNYADEEQEVDDDIYEDAREQFDFDAINDAYLTGYPVDHVHERSRSLPRVKYERDTFVGDMYADQHLGGSSYLTAY